MIFSTTITIFQTKILERLSNCIFRTKKHRKELQLLIKFRYNETLIALTKTLNNARWSNSLRCWYVKYSKENLDSILVVFKNNAVVNNSKLPKKIPFKRNLTQNQKNILNSFYLYLKGKRYSKSTIKIYIFFMADFVNFHTKKGISILTNRDVELFIETVFIERKYSISSQRQFISALKLFVNFYPKTNINNLTLERPKKSRKLPNVLSQEEVLQIIKCTQNLKHKAVITLIYSCGLRVSELTNLKLLDFKLKRKQLPIVNGKGRKDRYVSLAESFIPLLSNYYHAYKPKVYFVEGQYGAEAIRQFLRKSCRKANIYKTITPHTLRHSYATHLLENGVDIRYIQTLLGHEKPETTMIYTHVRRSDLMNISNLLDVALQNFRATDKTKTNVVLSGNI